MHASPAKQVQLRSLVYAHTVLDPLNVMTDIQSRQHLREDTECCLYIDDLLTDVEGTSTVQLVHTLNPECLECSTDS